MVFCLSPKNITLKAKIRKKVFVTFKQIVFFPKFEKVWGEFEIRIFIFVINWTNIIFFISNLGTEYFSKKKNVNST